MPVTEFIESLTLKEVIHYLSAIGGMIILFMEWDSKIPFNPISSVFKWFGRCLTRSLHEHIDELSKKADNNSSRISELYIEMDKRLLDNERKDDEKEMKRLRASIIMFSDSCGRGEKHTKGHFKNVFRDIDDYRNYCKKHEFPNNFIEREINYIQSVYDKCCMENKFKELDE